MLNEHVTVCHHSVAKKKKGSPVKDKHWLFNSDINGWEEAWDRMCGYCRTNPLNVNFTTDATETKYTPKKKKKIGIRLLF